MAYSTIADCRRVSGVDSTLVSDADVTSTITEMDKKVDRLLNTTFEPKTAISILDGNGKTEMSLPKYPINRIITLKINSTSVTPNNLAVYNESGIVRLTTDAEKSVFDDSKAKLNAFKWTYSEMEESTTETTTSNAESAGSAVTIEVASTTGISASDYVKIHSTDGYDEITQVDSVDSGVSITATISYDHEAGSRVVKMQTPTLIQRLSGILVGIALVVRVVGASFDEITGYGLPEITVQKGEPYTQWRETAMRLERERDGILKVVRQKPYVG